MSKRWLVWLQTAMVCSTLMLTGCENGNLFGKLTDVGDSNDPKVLYAEGQDALREGNYTEALNLFNKLLEIDPDNAQALYGAAVAAMGTTGISLGTLANNLVTQSSASTGITDIGSLIRQSRISISAVHTVDHSIMEGVELEDLNDVIDLVICRLEKITTGAADGSIPRFNIDVLVNFASVCFIRSVLRPLRAGFFDVLNTNGDIDLTAPNTAALNTSCTNDPEVVSLIGKDVAAAWALFNKAVEVLGLSNDQLVTQLRNDVAAAADLLLDNTNIPDRSLPANCLSLLQGMGIDKNTFDDPGATMVLTGPTGC